MDILHSFVHCLLHLPRIFTVRTHHNLDEPHFQAQWPYVANGYHTGKSRTNISIIADSSTGQCPLCSFHYILGVSGPCGVGSGLGGAPHSELPRGLISLTAGALTGNTCLSGYEKVFPSFFPRLGGFHDTCRPKAPSPRELNQHPDHRRENSSLGVHQTPSPKLITILLPSVCFIGVGG